MEKNIIMEINCKMEICTSENKMGRTIIQDVDNDNTFILIAIPIVNGINYPLTIGDVIECTYNSRDEKIYGFSAKVVGRKFDVIPLIVLQRQSVFSSVQRRDNVRFPFVKSMKYVVIDKCNEAMLKNFENYKYKKGHVMDISGGGMRIKINQKLDLGQLIMIKSLIDNEPFSLFGKISRVEGRDEENFIYGIKFNDIDSRLREDIIKYIFKNMRKLIERD